VRKSDIQCNKTAANYRVRKSDIQCNKTAANYRVRKSDIQCARAVVSYSVFGDQRGVFCVPSPALSLLWT